MSVVKESISVLPIVSGLDSCFLSVILTLLLKNALPQGVYTDTYGNSLWCTYLKFSIKNVLTFSNKTGVANYLTKQNSHIFFFNTWSNHKIWASTKLNTQKKNNALYYHETTQFA